MQHESLESIRFGPEPSPDREVTKLSQNAVLLVDDDPDIRSLTRTFLEHEGFRVYTSGDAHRAAQIFRSAPRIDLLITDIYMPERSGLELAHELKQLQQSLPVLMISGGSLDEIELERLQLEAWRFLSKPFLFTDLLSTVHEILKTNLDAGNPGRSRQIA
jgi:two-component system, chemotaxis family, chemotaxis protein CheY